MWVLDGEANMAQGPLQKRHLSSCRGFAHRTLLGLLRALGAMFAVLRLGGIKRGDNAAANPCVFAQGDLHFGQGRLRPRPIERVWRTCLNLRSEIYRHCFTPMHHVWKDVVAVCSHQNEGTGTSAKLFFPIVVPLGRGSAFRVGHV